MKKVVLIMAAMVIGLFFNSFAFAEEAPEKKEHGHHHKLIEPEKAKELKKQGYTKEDIFMAAVLGKKSGKNIDDVLSIYKEQKTWKKTAQELDIDSEEFERIQAMFEWKRFVKENKKEVIDYLATYTDKETSEIKAFMEDGYKLRFLIAAGVLAKLSDKTFDDILASKKDGTCFHDLMKELKVEEEDLYEELEQFKAGVKSKVKERP